VTGAIDERHMAHKHQVCIAALIGTLDVVSLRGTERCPALRCLTIRALVKFGIGVTQLDCNVTEFLAEMTNSIGAGDGSDKRRLAVSDVANSSNINSRLS